MKQVIDELVRIDEKDLQLLRSPLIHFLLAGILLFIVRAAWDLDAQSIRVEIRRSEIENAVADYERRSGRPANDAERRALEDQIVENALWLEEAWALGLHKVDPVVRQRLIQNMRFLEAENELPEDELIERAYDLGMHESDPVIQRRLVDRVQALLRAGVRSKPPGEEILLAHYSENADRWRAPVRLDLSHVYLSRDKRGPASETDASALLRLLIDQDLSVEDGIKQGDPFLSGHRIRGATRARIVARLGPAFEARVAEAQTERWIGPVESAFGTHLVWIHERVESRVPDYEEVRARVLEAWFRAQTRRSLRAEITRHRRNVEIHIIEDGHGAGSGS